MVYTNKLKYNQTLKLFFDFYVINEIWFKTIGLEQFGYALTKIIPYNKEKKIDEVFNLRISEMKERVIHCLETSVRGEIKHFNTEGPLGRHFYVNLNDKYLIYAKNLIKKYGKNKSKWPLDKIYEGFYLKGWNSDFGGKRWAKGTKFLIKLKDSKNIKDDIFLIDRIFDLYHNTGFMLNKTYFKYLDYLFHEDIKKKYKIRQSNPLNFRFKAKIDQMVNFCSTEVYKIYMANKNYLIAT